MWIFFLGGFVSVVADRDHPGFVVVRGRSREHVLAFLRHEPIKPGDRAHVRRVVRTPERDYLYRASVPPAVFVGCLEAIGREAVDVPNFKSACADAGAPRRWLSLLAKVWGVLFDYQSTTSR